MFFLLCEAVLLGFAVVFVVPFRLSFCFVFYGRVALDFFFNVVFFAQSFMDNFDSVLPALTRYWYSAEQESL